MKKRNFLKKTLAVVLVFAMLAPIMGNLKANVNEVQAEDTTNLSELLSVKCQVTDGVVTDTSIDKYRNNYVMRFVSSIDSLEYKEVGFEITYVVDEETGETETKTNKTKTVFTRIESTTGSTSEGRDTYSFSPKVISTDSEYFITAKWPVAPADVAVDYTVRAFARTTEGTVYGPARCVSADDGLTTCKTINMSFENTKGVDLTGVTTLGVNDNDAYSAAVIGVDGTTVHVRISGVDKSSLKSATSFTFKKDGVEVGSGIFRNLYTKYDKTDANTVDTSWYEAYLAEDSTETEFTIATSADLYGFAYLANTGNASDVKQNFSGKKIYLVSDISINDETLVTDSTDTYNYKTWYTYDEVGEKVYTETPTNSWTPIGRGEAFKGIFDAQMHTISGIYCSDGQENSGLFAVIREATIQNLKLTNSYINGTQIRTGSIVAQMNGGTLNTIYSDALVDSTSYYVGGLVGLCGYANMISNCWFNGSIKNTCTSQAPQTGGILGITFGSSSLQITNCLNSGTIDVSASTKENLQTGGLVGYNVATPTTITECLNTGTIKTNNENNYAGIIVGEINAKANSTVDCIRSYGYGANRVIGNMATTNDKIVGTFTITYVSGGKIFENVNRSSSAAAYQSVPIISMRNDESKFLGTAAQTNLEGLDFDNTWSVVAGSTPVLNCLKTTLIDDSWYDKNADTFVLYDKADLYGFAALSQTYNFAGKTVKLGNDIEVNIGDATNWSTCAPKYEWIPIGTETTPFAGTFDGNRHIISGLFLDTTSANSGLFGVTSSTSTVKNLVLENSYFTSTAANLGSIAGQGNGLFDTVKSEAIVKGSATAVGGLLGEGNSTDVVIQYCWFDGTVTNTGNSMANRGTGGLMGVLFDGASAKIKNCLNTGTVNAEAYKTIQGTSNVFPFAAGFVGYVKASNSSLSIANSLNTGDVLVSEEATGCYGLFVGYEAKASTSTNNYSLTPETWTEDNEVKEQYNPTKHTTVTAEQLKGDSAKTTLAKFDFTSTWTTVTDGTPVLNFSETNETNDTRWYDASISEYVLYDKADLYGLAKLSETIGFGRKTVKLAQDIVVNEGNAESWAKDESLAPNSWTPIGSKIEFNGTFDGQGHTISGVYLNATSSESGLFAKTNVSSTIKNLSLKNSYFESTEANLGSIAGRGKGKFYNLYSDAIVTTSNAGGGGLVGAVEATGTYVAILKNCWFDGSVTNTGNGSKGVRGTGGILGVISKNANVEIENCLNEGTIDAKAYDYDQNADENVTNVSPFVGGIVGYIKDNATVDITGCLNVGEIKYDNDATGGYNPLVGFNTAGTTLTISGCYATKESCETIGLSNISSDSATQVAADTIKGDIAEAEMKLLDWNNWECRDNDFPAVILATTTSEEVDYEATEADSALLAALYDDYTLYQGDLHGHANNGGSSDGHTDLSEWINQMANAELNLELDFAASLDHRQTWHITQTLWQENIGKLIYGTEAETTIEEQEARLHYNMIFAEQSQMKNVLNSFSEFDYEEYADDENSGHQVLTNPLGRTAFGYDPFTKERFGLMIDKVKDQEGLFVLAHPMQSPNFSKNALDFWFRDYIGFEVVYTQLNCGNTRDNYAAWKSLLAEGARMWACSGSDTHDDLTNAALTSVYAKATDKEEGNLVNYLKDGNFSAGSVGIQMCVGDTPMGGHRNFANQRVVVNVGEMHTSVYNSANKYRVDILNEDGIVYSQALIIDEITKTPSNGTIAFNADANSDFYRVVVYDMTEGYRIAYGNPIWNDK